ncbi:hypothetical protein [Micromonospora sp. CPCC 205561]|uniref:hypothetical protein n=1 Tax=Micromonospora sp. CPCC 205561 TaxID=3122407 RepID=UPI002FF082E9
MTKLLDWIARRLALWMTASAALTLVSGVLILNAQAGIDWGDAPAWAAFAVSLGGTGIALHAARSSKTAARAAEVSAQAGVRQAAAAEEQVSIARRTLELAEQQGDPKEAPVLMDRLRDALTEEPPYVAWWLGQRSKNTYILRNIGTDTARTVEIDQSRIKCAVRGATTADEIAPQASIEILLMPAWGAPKPNELWVRWDGHPDWKAVPLP